jgi:glycosyltransferase involved in cell wall biosynthesis
MTPKYSIIIPARNGGKYLPTCINTILEQSYGDYELIISDDHSSDDSKQYLASLTHLNVYIF